MPVTTHGANSTPDSVAIASAILPRGNDLAIDEVKYSGFIFTVTVRSIMLKMKSMTGARRMIVPIFLLDLREIIGAAFCDEIGIVTVS